MAAEDGYSVGDKAAQEGSKSGAFDGFGVSMAPPCFSNLSAMAHPHRPFQSGVDDEVVVAVGPTSTRSMAGDIYEASGGGGGGGCCLRNVHYYQQQRPFETQTNYPVAALKFPGGGGGGQGMAASIGFPFTNAQWKELERQAMIYKYMMASVPVPPHLLIPPSFRNLPPDPAAAASLPLFGSNGLGSRLRSGGGDLEPGRCKRTDGKKWRCSRDAAPDQKYCERHLHRGRPRSRKPVELLPNDNATIINLNNNAANNKKTRLVTAAVHSDSGFPGDRAGSGSQLTGVNSLPIFQSPACIDKGDIITTCDLDSPFVLARNQPRELDWLVNGGPFAVATNDQDHQWHGRAAESSSINYQDEPSDLDLLGLFGSADSDHGNQNSFSNEAPRPFIDAWASSRNTADSPSCEGDNVTDNKSSRIPISLGLNRSHELASSPWTAPTTPGGPLAEVLNLTSTTTVTGQSSPVAESGDYGVSPSATTVSSPSGVLQKTLVSFSDGSGNSSPTLACSTANCHEIALPWLDQRRGSR